MLITAHDAYSQHLRDIYLIAEGVVAEILPEDTTGVPHQRFIILTDESQTILIVHNIEQGTPLKLHIGERVKVEGTYVWNRHGGLIHETHLGLHKNQPQGAITKNTV